ncbi:DUF6390 family protein [Sporichthya brevicatena]|uniref:DUF6390 family protein n=1 Tax=Sporichthya brevicatena TaxID=171442 RepID=A0ABN1GN71_9ACTN
MPRADRLLAEGVSGSVLFARYAHGPNALGYCGPAGAAVLARAACGQDEPAAVEAAARRFSGAWPYQETIANLTGRSPMDPDVVRGYWVGNQLTDELPREQFAEVLLSNLRAQAGHYWPHLSEDLSAEVAPSHTFHVFGVYPWSRLLDAGRPEPLHVLESCRIGWGRVIAVHADQLTVRTRRLDLTDGRLSLSAEYDRRVDYRVDGDAFVADPVEGDLVALHWDFACDRLTEFEVTRLEADLMRQLELVAQRGTS